MNRLKDFDRWLQNLNNASSRTEVAHIVNSFMAYYNLNYYPGNAFEDTAKVFEEKEWPDVANFLRFANNKMEKLSVFPEFEGVV